MLTTRIIPCLDVSADRVVKGIKFKNLEDIGDAVALAEQYYKQGADELVLLDVDASFKNKEIIYGVIEKVSNQIFIPLTVGGGIKRLEDIRMVLSRGGDKVAICTAAIENPDIISQASKQFGSQCIVLSIDAKKEGNSWYCYTYGGRYNTGIDAIEWAKKGEKLGAGEILLNSIDMDGTKEGFDIDLIKKVSESVRIPVIASGGAGNPEQVLHVIIEGKADAVLLASIIHSGEYTTSQIKNFLKSKGVIVR